MKQKELCHDLYSQKISLNRHVKQRLRKIRLFNLCDMKTNTTDSPTMTREQRPAPHRHAHGDLTSLTPEESLPELPVVPLRKPHSGTAARENPRYAPVITRWGTSFLPGMESKTESSLQTPQEAWLSLGLSVGSKRYLSGPEGRAESFASPRDEAWLPVWVWNATPSSCRTWRGKLGPGHKPRWGLFCTAVTREQSPALPCKSNWRLDFPGPIQLEAWIRHRNSRIPPKLEKIHVVPPSALDEALARSRITGILKYVEFFLLL